MLQRTLLVLWSILWTLLPSSAASFSVASDTLRGDSVRHLDEVVVTADGHSQSAFSSSPRQIKARIDIEQLPAIQVSDVLKFLSGVNIKDYGGIGGLKTVSVRSLGAAHTGVAYDGISVADGQNGQIDIGRFSLDNVGTIELSNGQDDRIFVPARQLASAGLITIRTTKPTFRSRPLELNRKYHWHWLVVFPTNPNGICFRLIRQTRHFPQELGSHSPVMFQGYRYLKLSFSAVRSTVLHRLLLNIQKGGNS